MRIDRCVCTDQTFAALLRQARAEGWDVDQLRRCTGAGEHCGMCRPYLRETVRTGQTVFLRLLPQEAEALS